MSKRKAAQVHVLSFIERKVREAFPDEKLEVRAYQLLGGGKVMVCKKPTGKEIERVGQVFVPTFKFPENGPWLDFIWTKLKVTIRRGLKFAATTKS